MKQRITSTLATISASVLGWAAVARGALADDPSNYAPNSSFASLAGLPETSAVDFALGIGRALFTLLGLIALVLIIYAGFMLLTSQGESEKVKKGRDTLLWAIVGLIVILSSLGILTYIDSVLFPAT